MILPKIKVLRSHGTQYIPDLKNVTLTDEFRGRPELTATDDMSDVEAAAAICPTRAITAAPFTLDLGRCLFCGECALRAPRNIRFTNDYRMGSASREALVVRPGDTAIDIGANLGYYTRPMSRIVGPEGRVYAVEPVPVICEVLRRNLRGRDNVRILNCALGDGDRPVEMANDSVAAAGYFGTGRNFVDDGRNARGDAIRFKAQMRRGSSLFADVDRIDFIKCDIEGYECVVLGEMMPLVRRHHPTILVESGGDNRRSLIVQFGSEGYAPFTLGDDGREHPLDTAADDGRDIIFRYKEPIEQ